MTAATITTATFELRDPANNARRGRGRPTTRRPASATLTPTAALAGGDDLHRDGPGRGGRPARQGPGRQRPGRQRRLVLHHRGADTTPPTVTARDAGGRRDRRRARPDASRPPSARRWTAATIGTATFELRDPGQRPGGRHRHLQRDAPAWRRSPRAAALAAGDDLHRDGQGRGDRPARQGRGRQRPGRRRRLVVHHRVRPEPARAASGRRRRRRRCWRRTTTSAVEVGVKFRADVAGYITGVRFYKGPGNTGTHVGHLWTSSGHAAGDRHLHRRDGAAAGSRSASPRRWRSRPTPPTSPPTTRPIGRYSRSSNYFAARRDRQRAAARACRTARRRQRRLPLRQRRRLPDQTYQSENYWVDVVFTTGPPAGPPPASALSFNGTNAYVTVASTTALRVATNQTVEAWIKPTAAGATVRQVAGKRNSWELGVQAQGAGYKVVFSAFNGAKRTVDTGAVAAYPLNQWRHVAATYDGSALRLFVDGALVSTLATTGDIALNTNALEIGRVNASGSYFAGAIDEARVSAVVRYTAAFAPPTAPLAADGDTRGLWRFDEGGGTRTVDASGLGHTGTLTNGPAWTTDSPLAGAP